VLHGVRIDKATRTLHTECPVNAAGFVIGTAGLSALAICADTAVTMQVGSRCGAPRACQQVRTAAASVNHGRQIVALRGDTAAETLSAPDRDQRRQIPLSTPHADSLCGASGK
jgi:L-2-hydroxyglutarate oxidase LhgO